MICTGIGPRGGSGAFLASVTGIVSRTTVKALQARIIFLGTDSPVFKSNKTEPPALWATRPRMQITPYNLHVLGSFPPSPGCLSAPSLLGGLGADTVI